MVDDALAELLGLARQWNVSLADEQARRILRFIAMLLEWNRRINVTGARSLRELLTEHIPDSFALARLCLEARDVVDVGSGGGLPAIPFAILRPDCAVTLVEPRAKRVAFLRAAARECECGSVSVVRCRVEEIPSPRYSVASSKATFAPAAWVEIASRLLAVGGKVVVFSTARPTGLPARAVLVDEVAYRTEQASPRWCGSYCFT